MANDSQIKAVFSTDSLLQVISEAEESSKVILQNPDAEVSLALFLLMRKAFNDAYDKVKEQITEAGIQEIGNTFSGLTGSYVRGTHSERGGSKYMWNPTGGEEIDPEFVTVETRYKVETKAVDKYLKKTGELPPGIYTTERKKSLSLSPTKAAKELLKDNNKGLFYDLEVKEIEGGQNE